MHMELLDEVDQFSVQSGDLIGVQWLDGQAIPFKQCSGDELPIKTSRSRVIKTAGGRKYFRDRQCRHFPVKVYIQEVSIGVN